MRFLEDRNDIMNEEPLTFPSRDEQVALRIIYSCEERYGWVLVAFAFSACQKMDKPIIFGDSQPIINSHESAA